MLKYACLAVMVVAASGQLLSALSSLHHLATYDSIDPQIKVYLSEMIAAAETCQLTVYLQKNGGTDLLVKVISALPAAEAEKYKAYFSEQLAAEAAGKCTRGRDRDPTRPEETRPTEAPTRAPTRDPAQVATFDARVYLSEMLAAAEACQLTVYLQKMGGTEFLVKVISALPDDEALKYRAYFSEQLAAEAAGKCTRGRDRDPTRPEETRPTEAPTRAPTRDPAQVATFDQSTLLRQLMAAAADCSLTSFIQRVGYDSVSRLLLSLPADEAEKYKLYISERLRLESSGACRSA